VAHVLNTPVNIIEKWPPEKVLAYFDTATVIMKARGI